MRSLADCSALFFQSFELLGPFTLQPRQALQSPPDCVMTDDDEKPLTVSRDDLYELVW